ncbi:MAG: alpha/beta hydrolase [Faecalibacterium sp.]|nr:alpha/beta hydrolase [Ruminococcus sp.]MCM1392793.1 alpha/beta hydrolase [Ruminococcus sp.]MCM1485525.1 alpha/beta hydrolase [Faecalibacterium sp.]
MKKVLSVLLAVVMIFSCATLAFAADTTADKPFENSEFFTDGEYTLHYRTYLPNSEVKNQILLLHGFGLSTVSFEGLAAEYVSAGYKVVLVDLPNFGYSTRETTSMNLVAREELVYDLMKSLGGKWILGGHSMGGGVAANIAIAYPDSVSGLVLLAPQTTSDLPKSMNLLMRSCLVGGMFNTIISFAANFPPIIRMMINMSFSDNTYGKSYDTKRISDPLKISGTGAGIAIMTTHATSTDAAKFGELTIPIIIATCANDKIAMQSSIDALINAEPANLTTYEFEQGGHMFMEYNPQGVAEITLKTIEQC